MMPADSSSAAAAAAEHALGPCSRWPGLLGGDADDALVGCPIPAVGIDAQGHLLWANAAGRQLLPGLRADRPLLPQCPLDPAAAARLAAALAAPDGADTRVDDLHLGGATLQARVQHLASGRRLVWLMPAVQKAPDDARTERLAELLRLACGIGRLGVWERDLLTGHGLWDATVFRTRGLEGAGLAPSFDDAAGGVVEADLPAFEAAMRQSLLPPPPGQPRPHWRVRYRIQGRDGVVRALHKQWFVEHAPDGRPLRLVGLVMDDSDAFALRRTRDESVSQLAMAAELTGLAAWRHDLATDRVALNRQALELFELPPTTPDISGEAFRALLRPLDRVRTEPSVPPAPASGHPAEEEFQTRRRDGHRRTLVVRRALQQDATGQPLAVVGITLDLTDRNHERRRAAELARRFELAIATAGIGYWTFEAQSRTPHWSAPLYELHGLPAESPPPTLRRWLADFVHPDDRDAARHRFAAWLGQERRAGTRLDIDLRIRRPDGGVRALLIQVVVEEDGVGPCHNLFGLVLDVTERRRAEAERRDRERAERESEAKSRFLSRMNHELRTPLNAVLGFAQLLLHEERGTDPQAAKRLERVAHIRSAGLQLLELINDALDLSSSEGGETPLLRQPVDLRRLVTEMLPLVEALCVERGVRVDATGSADGWALADPTRLRQVLLNLVSNAVKYNRGGGSLRVDARTHGDTAVIRVADTGRGMTALQLGHLFEPFNRLGVEQEGIAGSGIGLTIVKSLTERMGGSIRVESEVGVGSVFELRLPASDGPVVVASVPNPRPTVARLAGAARRVLYIEDDPVNAMLISQLLARRQELALHVAGDGAAGVEMAKRLQPGLILLDMQLPDIDGFEVLARLRADPTTAAIPVVGLSANAMRDDIDRAHAAGMDGYWSKPVDHAALLAALDGMFDLDTTAADLSQ